MQRPFSFNDLTSKLYLHYFDNNKPETTSLSSGSSQSLGSQDLAPSQSNFGFDAPSDFPTSSQKADRLSTLDDLNYSFNESEEELQRRKEIERKIELEKEKRAKKEMEKSRKRKFV